MTNEMESEYEGLEIRTQQSRWRSCSTNGPINLNWRLSMAPRDAIDYVVPGLPHLCEPNHTDAIWFTVENHCPKNEKHRNWLAENSSSLVFTEDL